jgi:hypothetical protein
MAIRRVDFVFDTTLRPETAGVYCQRALERLRSRRCGHDAAERWWVGSSGELRGGEGTKSDLIDPRIPKFAGRSQSIGPNVSNG